MRTIISLVVVFIIFSLNGCYTQLMSSAMLEKERSAVTQQSVNADTLIQDQQAIGQQSNSHYSNDRQNPYYSSSVVPCNCTAWEIQNDACWCTCERCGTYHKVGYDYCPTGLYSSYWGWDYYERVPWWRRNNNNRYRDRDTVVIKYVPSNPAPTNPGTIIYQRPSKERNKSHIETAPSVQPKTATQSQQQQPPIAGSQYQAPDTVQQQPAQPPMRERPSKGRF
ncbi:MAG: hypothetical protein JNL74_09440 [Fibrobacteres bacterium]|nr:hypothetical protein [Fibrobacterota bacterium]